MSGNFYLLRCFSAWSHGWTEDKKSFFYSGIARGELFWYIKLCLGLISLWFLVWLQPRALDIALRLPPLFLMDQLLLHDMGINFFDRQYFETNGNVTTQKSHFHILSFDRYFYLILVDYLGVLSDSKKIALLFDPSDDTPSANLTQHFNDSNLAKAFVMLNKNIYYILLPHLVRHCKWFLDKSSVQLILKICVLVLGLFLHQCYCVPGISVSDDTRHQTNS